MSNLFTMFYRIILWSVVGLAASIAHAQEVRFEARTNVSEVALGDHFQITYQLHNAEGNRFQAPKFEGFEVMSGPNQSTNMTIINGMVTQAVGFSYYLRPTKIGTFTLPAASIRVKNQKLTSNTVTVKVVAPQGSTAQSQTDLNSELGKKVFIRAIPTQETAYLGEQIALDIKLYTKVGIDNYGFMNDVQFEGFFAKEMLDYESGVNRQTINGESYTTKTIRRVLLFPQKTGRLTLPAFTVGIVLSQQGGGFFGSFFSSPGTTYEIQSVPLAIEVRPFPAGAPPDFSGAVGKYTMEAIATKTTVSTDESISLHLRIDGNGDLKRFGMPTLGLPADSFEVYDPLINDTEDQKQGTVTGTRVLDYNILPKYAGDYSFSPTFTYFDPQTKQYQTLRAAPIRLSVRQGTGAGATTTSPAANAATFHPLKTAAVYRSAHSAFYGSTVFWVLFVLPWLLFGGLWYYQYRQTQSGILDPVAVRTQRANAVAATRLKQAEAHQQAGNTRAFYDETAQALWGYVSDKLHLPAAQLSKINVHDKLLGIGLSPAVADQFLAAITTCEMARFAGMDNATDMVQVYQTAAELIGNIEAVAPTPIAKRGKWLTAIFVFVILPCAYSATPAEQFQAGINAYQAQDYATAIEIWEAIVADAPYTAEAHYNLGAAYYQQRDLGKAVLHYERALRAQPRDADARHNLALVRQSLPDNLPTLSPFFLVRWYRSAAGALPASAWAVLCLLFLAVGSAGGAWWLIGKTRTHKKICFTTGIATTLIALLWLAFAQYRHATDRAQAVITAAEVALRTAPDELNEPLLMLHGGTIVRKLDAIGEWYKVVLTNGEQGWLPAASITFIVPALLK